MSTNPPSFAMKRWLNERNRKVFLTQSVSGTEFDLLPSFRVSKLSPRRNCRQRMPFQKSRSLRFHDSASGSQTFSGCEKLRARGLRRKRAVDSRKAVRNAEGASMHAYGQVAATNETEKDFLHTTVLCESWRLDRDKNTRREKDSLTKQPLLVRGIFGVRWWGRYKNVFAVLGWFHAVQIQRFYFVSKFCCRAQ